MSECVSASISFFVNISLFLSLSLYIYIDIYIYVYVCVCVWMCLRVCLCVRVCLWWDNASNGGLAVDCLHSTDKEMKFMSLSFPQLLPGYSKYTPSHQKPSKEVLLMQDLNPKSIYPEYANPEYAYPEYAYPEYPNALIPNMLIPNMLIKKTLSRICFIPEMQSSKKIPLSGVQGWQPPG